MKFKVHGAPHKTTVQIEATTPEGHKFVAAYPAMVVELVPTFSYGRTITHVVPLMQEGDEEAVMAEFLPDGEIEVTIGERK